MTTIDRILDLMDTHNVNAAKLTREIPLTNGLISQWKQGKQKPSLEAVNKIANYFNVSLDYLVNGKQLIEPLNPNQQELLDLYSQLDPIKQAEFKGELKGYLKAKNNS